MKNALKYFLSLVVFFTCFVTVDVFAQVVVIRPRRAFIPPPVIYAPPPPVIYAPPPPVIIYPKHRHRHHRRRW